MSGSSARFAVAPVVEDRDVLAAARGFADQIFDAELGLMSAALEWVHRNPGVFMSGHQDRWGTAQMGEVDWEGVAKSGCALVDEMSIPEFGYATGMSDQVARSLIHDAVVMFYRFPRTWARMSSGQVPIWRARLVPRLGAGVEAKAARYVDRHLDQPGARFTRGHIQRLIDEARLRYTPDEVAQEVAANAEQRGVHIDTRAGAHLGLADLQACLELPDALDLEAALAHGAAQLKAAGSTEPLHVRRAQALGDLARTAQTPTLLPAPGKNTPGPDGSGPDGSGQDGNDRMRWDGRGVPRSGVKIYIHLNHTALRCTCTPKTSPTTPFAGTAPPKAASDGTAPAGTSLNSPPSTSADGTALPGFAFGGTALPKGAPGGSFVEYFVTGPGAEPGPGITPAPEPPAPEISTPPEAATSGASASLGSGGFLMPDVQREQDRLGEACRVDGTGMPTSVLAPETVRGWFARPHAYGTPGVKICVQQVLDPLEFISSQAYEVPQRARQATILTDRSCVFPYCHAIAERADCDHITPYDQGGPSCTCNLAALCRFHHRLKTHGQHHQDHKWTYAPLGEGKYVWHGPNDIHLLRTPTGTHVLPGDIFTTRPTDTSPTPGIRYPDGTTTGFDEHHPAFTAVTNPLALPQADPEGHPQALPEAVLMQQVLLQRAQDPEANTYYQRYAAAGKHLARPEIQYCELPPQTSTAKPDSNDPAVTPDNDDTDENPGPFYNPGPPPF